MTDDLKQEPLTAAQIKELEVIAANKEANVAKAISGVYLTREQRAAQTAEFLAKLDAQRKAGGFIPKPTINDAPASFKLR
jgi:hypothetical protein